MVRCTSNYNRRYFGLLVMMSLLLCAMTSAAWGQATSITSTGYNANIAGNGTLQLGYTTGNLGNSWSEGEWVPYQLLIENVQTDYPDMVGFPDILMSYDFTSHDYRFVDLVRGLQAGDTELTDLQGWPKDDGTAYVTTTIPQLDSAQNDLGNAPPLDNEWTGFTLLNLPESQINRGPDGVSQGTPTDAEHTFRITRQDLVDAGVDTTADLIVIYYQLHESRSFIWFNSLQDQYDQSPTDAWGGYLYSLDGFPTDSRQGSGYVPGSSGHIEVEFAGGSKTVPIPIPERLPGAVSGLKWLDTNGDGVFDPGESTLSGWRIYVSGTLENIYFATDTLTDGSGNYSFPNLTSNVTWTIKEDSQRDTPAETGYMQTYPEIGDILGVGTGIAVGPPPAGVADVGWSVMLTEAVPDQGDMNFGNKLCQVTITCPPDDTLECTESTDPSNTGYPTIDGNCGPFDTTYSDVVTPGNCPQEQTIERTWVVTDQIGNADTCVQTIEVIDDTPPVIICPADTVFSCDDVGGFGEATATDNCDPNPNITFVDDTLSANCPLEISRTWIATDACGNADSCVQNIRVVDETAPVIVCPADTTFECDNVGDFGVATATDNCDNNPSVELVARDSIPGACVAAYQLHLTWVATDVCGNADTCVQTVTVEDTTPPEITCPSDLTFECDSIGDFGSPTATDNCDDNPTISLVARDSIPGQCARDYELRLTYEAMDACGNADSCTQSVFVGDTTPPEITCASDLTFECDSIGDFGSPTATDNCDPNPTISLIARDSIPGNCSQEYQLVLSYEAMDDCGNADTCQQSIYVVDDTPPVISCPADQVFDCSAGNAGEATATDNCDPDPEITFVDDTLSTTCPLEITRTWIATDACGNADSCVQNIRVVDETAPVIVCPADTTFECDNVGNFGVATATDNCDANPRVVLAVRDSIPGACAAAYQLQLTWVATDVCGNADTCYQTITVEDTEAPVLSCPPDTTFECDNVPAEFGDATATDNCDPNPSVELVDTDTIPGNCPYSYQYVFTWTATDACGNADTCVQTITVEDTLPPLLICAADDTIGCADDLVFTDPQVSDNCDADPEVDLAGVDTTAGPGDGQFTYTAYWVAADTCGNTSDTCSQTIIREACPQEFCTYTQGGWGTDCPESQVYDMYSTQPGCILLHYFDQVFPEGVTIGDEVGGYTAHWSSAAAVQAFLPAGSTPGVLTGDLSDPTSTPAGVLAGQLLALKLNVGFTCEGIQVLLGLLDAEGCYADYPIPDSCGGPFAGLTVAEFVELADVVVGGDLSALDPYSASVSDVNFTATCLNEAFDNCVPALSADLSSSISLSKSEAALPTKYELSQNRPNPFNPTTEISFALPVAGEVRIEVYNITGQRVTELVNGYYPAGYHSVTWNGAGMASGVYFYRIHASSFTETKKMLLLK
jgi:FlaG/FlaF family flagellin (archaellin)